MACACNYLGPDLLSPEGKWICEKCGGSCSCDEIWNSNTVISKKESTKEPAYEPNEESHLIAPQSSRTNYIPRLDAIKCPGNHIRNKFNENYCKTKILNKPSKKDISVSCGPCDCILVANLKTIDKISSREFQPDKKYNSVEENIKKETSSKEVQTESSKTETRDCVKQKKCKSCKCKYDQKGNKIKSKECRAASERKNKLMENMEKEKSAEKFESELKKPAETKMSHSMSDFISQGKDILPKNILIFAKKGNYDIIECKSSIMGLISPLKHSKYQKYLNEIEEQRDLQVSQSVERQCKNVPDEYSPSLDQSIQSFVSARNVSSNEESNSANRSEKMKQNCEKPERPLTCLEISKQKTVQMSCFEERDEEIRNLKRAPCEKSQLAVEKQTKDNSRIRKPFEEKNQFPRQDQQEEITKRSEEKNLDRNLQCDPCNHCDSVISVEELCPCGCGYFTEGVPETRPRECTPSLKTIPQAEDNLRQKTGSKTKNCECGAGSN